MGFGAGAVHVESGISHSCVFGRLAVWLHRAWLIWRIFWSATNPPCGESAIDLISRAFTRTPMRKIGVARDQAEGRHLARDVCAR